MKTRTIDTNILVRILARDDSRQWRIAANLLETSHLVIMPTVLLETDWVLRKSIGLNPSEIAALFRMMLALEVFVFTAREACTAALEAFELGMEFADALHVCLMGRGETFITFDRDLVKLANKHIHHASVELAF